MDQEGTDRSLNVVTSQQQASRGGSLHDDEVRHAVRRQRGDGPNDRERRKADSSLPESFIRPRTGAAVKSEDKEHENDKQGADVLWRLPWQSNHLCGQTGARDRSERGSEIAADQDGYNDGLSVLTGEPGIAVLPAA